VTLPSLRSAATAAGVAALAILLMGLALAAVVRFWPRPNPLPAQLARTDEKTATRAATAIAADVEQRNADATVHIDLTTKAIRDAFDALPPPPPAPAPGAEPRPLPAAPVDSVRDRLNESIARANRAAGAAGAPD
jgi:hypothetical protein